MKIHLTGEDGYTLFVLNNDQYLDLIKKDLELKTIDEIWYRPSFGRGGGPKHSGFGEADAVIIGEQEINNEIITNIVFLESKQGGIVSNKTNIHSLSYQFFMKFALIDRIWQGSDDIYYSIKRGEGKFSDNVEKEISNKLFNFYKRNGGTNKERKGWRIDKITKDSPLLLHLKKYISDAKEDKIKLKFSFYIISFAGSNKVSSQFPVENIFGDLSKNILSKNKKYSFDFSKIKGQVFIMSKKSTKVKEEFCVE